MSRIKVAPLLLAASVFLTGATATLVGSWSPVHAITSVEELRDVNTNSWAYQALSDLVEKYDVIEGYPDYTFKGNHTASRYELAAALNATIKAVGRDLARLGAEKANKSDLATLAKLQEEFKDELAALNARTGALESRAAAIEAKNAEQDTRLDLLEKTQLHGDLSFGFIGDLPPHGIGAKSQEGISAIGRLRLGVKVPVIASHDDSPVGEGDVIARLVGAFGRTAPIATPGAINSNPISGYSAIAGNASQFNEGVGTSSLGGLGRGGVTGFDDRQNLYIESAYYKQHFKSGIPVISDLIPFLPNNDNFRSSSDSYIGVVPWRTLFNRSPYKGDELNQFQNTALVNNPGFLVNNITPTIAHSWHQGLGSHFSVDLTGAASTLDNSDAMNGFNVTEELALNYDTWFLGKKLTAPGTVYGGAYQIFFNGATNIANLTNIGYLDRDGAPLNFGPTGKLANNDIYSFFGGINQQLFRGLGVAGDYVLNSANENTVLLSALQNGTGANASLNTPIGIGGGRLVGVHEAYSVTATLPLSFFYSGFGSRAKDLIGVGYSLINPIQDTGVRAFRHQDEQVLEAFYKFALNNSVSIIPSAQAIISRDGVGNNGTDLVFGLRTSYVF